MISQTLPIGAKLSFVTLYEKKSRLKIVLNLSVNCRPSQKCWGCTREQMGAQYSSIKYQELSHENTVPLPNYILVKNKYAAIDNITPPNAATP